MGRYRGFVFFFVILQIFSLCIFADYQQVKLVASDGSSNSSFGFSVAVSGDTLVMGAYNQNSYSGAVYVFVRSGNTWVQQQKITETEYQTNSWFGDSVSISGDTLLIGAVESGADDRGAAYIYVRSGNTWSQQAKLLPSDSAPGDYFAEHVCISGDTR